MEKITLPIPDDHVTPDKPDFQWLGTMLMIVVGTFVLGYGSFLLFSKIIVSNISLEKEISLFGDVFVDTENMEIFDLDILETPISIPENYTVHLSDDEEINAFATIGGNIIINKGLLESIDYEEELIFILGHEMEHIKNRDPLNALAADIPFYLTLTFLGADIGIGSSQLTSLATNYISKNVELKADIGGVELVEQSGGNIGCIVNFFEKEDNKFMKYLELFSGHPTTQKRIDYIKDKNNGDGDYSKCTPFEYSKLTL